MIVVGFSNKVVFNMNLTLSTELTIPEEKRGQRLPEVQSISLHEGHNGDGEIGCSHDEAETAPPQFSPASSDVEDKVSKHKLIHSEPVYLLSAQLLFFLFSQKEYAHPSKKRGM